MAITSGKTAVMCFTNANSSRFRRSGDAALACSSTEAKPSSTADHRGATCTYQVGAVNLRSLVMTAFSPACVSSSRVSRMGRKASVPASRCGQAENVASWPGTLSIPLMKWSSRVVLPVPGSPVRHTMRTAPSRAAVRFSCRILVSSSRTRTGPC